MTGSERGYSLLRKGRHSQPGGVYFITISTYRRISHFNGFWNACAMCRQIHDLAALNRCKNLCCIWTPPDSRGISYQTSDAYVYSAFQWRRYLPALNVCAPRSLYGSMDSMASTRIRFHRSGYLLSDRGLSLNSYLLAAAQAANG